MRDYVVVPCSDSGLKLTMLRLRCSGSDSVPARLAWLRLLGFCVGFLLPLHSSAQESLQQLLQRLSTSGELQIAGARVHDLSVTQEFYASTAYAPVWTSSATLDELADSIEQAWREGMNPQDYHQQQVLGLRDATLNLDVASRDLLLTDALVRLTYHYALGKLEPKDFAATWNFEHRLPAVDPVEWLGRVTDKGGIAAGLDKLKPSSAIYQHLVSALAQYRAIQTNGGWTAIDEGPTLRSGDSGPRVAQLRIRLLGDGEDDTASAVAVDFFDAELEQAVMSFQRRHRLEADGVVGKQTLAAMNVTVAQRIDQIRVNLERARVLQDIPPTAVVVDIAGFEVSLFRDGQRLLRSRAQVGRPYRSTPVFRDTISYIEFNPTWTVPPTILKNDVLPAIKRDPGYLRRRNMQVLASDGTVVNPGNINWQNYPQQGFPYSIRQQPGPENALGRMKIMFPNEHLVYLHDTPSRDLFNRSERTSSSGCIRVEKIDELVVLLLDDPQRWGRADIDAIIDARKPRRISLVNPVPIYLVYWTVQVEADGEVHFKRDPYNQDGALLKALERPLVPDGARVSRSRPQELEATL
jgi:L,D-transpeptidase YcbB